MDPCTFKSILHGIFTDDELGVWRLESEEKMHRPGVERSIVATTWGGTYIFPLSTQTLFSFVICELFWVQWTMAGRFKSRLGERLSLSQRNLDEYFE